MGGQSIYRRSKSNGHYQTRLGLLQRRPKKKRKRHQYKNHLHPKQFHDHTFLLALNYLESEDFDEIVDFDEDKMYQYIDQETIIKMRNADGYGKANVISKKQAPPNIKFNFKLEVIQINPFSDIINGKKTTTTSPSQ